MSLPKIKAQEFYTRIKCRDAEMIDSWRITRIYSADNKVIMGDVFTLPDDEMKVVVLEPELYGELRQLAIQKKFKKKYEVEHCPESGSATASTRRLTYILDNEILFDYLTVYLRRRKLRALAGL